MMPNEKLTDDEEGASDARLATGTWSRSSSFGRASCYAASLIVAPFFVISVDVCLRKPALEPRHTLEADVRTASERNHLPIRARSQILQASLCDVGASTQIKVGQIGHGDQ